MNRIYKFFLILVCLFQVCIAECMNSNVKLEKFDQTVAAGMPKSEDNDFENARSTGGEFGGNIIYFMGNPIGIIYMTGNLTGGTSDLKIVIHPDYRGKYPGENVAATAEALFIKANPGIGIGIGVGNVASLKTFIRAIRIGNLEVKNQSDQTLVTADQLEAIIPYFEAQARQKEAVVGDSRFEFGVYVEAREFEEQQS